MKILVTGAAGQFGSVGRTLTGLLLERGLPVRAMVRCEDDRAAALRAAAAEVVVGNLLEPTEVYRAVSGCPRVFSGGAGAGSDGTRNHTDTGVRIVGPVRQSGSAEVRPVLQSRLG